jgi:alanine dehydrogenase
MKPTKKKPVVNLSKEALFPQEEILAYANPNKSFKIGIPKELDKYENRVPLIPQTVEVLTNRGLEVIIETGSGERAGFPDHHYSEAGAIIVDNPDIVFQSDVILKIAPLTSSELKKIEDNKVLISAFHAQNQEKTNLNIYKKKHLTCIGFEYIMDEQGSFPFVRSMSEIAGSASILLAADFLSSGQHGMGKLLGSITGVNPAEIIIIGAGTVGEYAAKAALGLGASVKVFDNSLYKLRNLKSHLKENIFTSVLQTSVLRNALIKADVVIGAMWFDESRQQVLINEDWIKMMKKGSVIIDVSIDRGYCFETSHMTNHGKPTFIKHGVIHYAVPNIASHYAKTASYALSNLLEQSLIELSESGSITQAIRQNTTLRNGTYFFNGILTNYFIASLFDIPSKDINLLLSAY